MAGGREGASYGAKYLAHEGAFRRPLTSPGLLWGAPPAPREAPLLFSTRAGEKVARPSPGRAVIFFVQKSMKNAFADEVTVGRTQNNDICIVDNSVSRFHAYFAPEKKGAGWSVVDANSTA